MTSEFRDLDDFLVVTPIRLPIRGKEYEFPGAISARSGLLLQRLSLAAERAKEDLQSGKARPQDLVDVELLDDDQEADLRKEVMGDAELEMIRDGLTSAHTAHVFQALVIWHMAGKEAAKLAWESLGEAAAPNRATRRASKGSASTTKKPASTSGTSTRKPAGKARRGASSSKPGDS